MRLCSSAKRFALLAAVAVCVISTRQSEAQFFRGGAVGGVAIDAQGVVTAPEVGHDQQMMAAWQAGLQRAPGDLQKFVDLRFVSLKKLDEQIAAHLEAGEELPDEVKCLAGLLRVKYVLVYPEQGDIVLAGPAEGWKVDRLGNVVGATSNRPVLTLDDLVVAIEANQQRGGPVISCSIDPTQEGLQRVQQVIQRFTNRTAPAQAGRAMEQALGMQTITVTGVPATSHFARTIVAADFRMKRLAMDLEPAPTGGLPSYLDVAGARAESFPRWWLAANYEPLLKDAAGLAWEIRGQGVKCMTETDFVDAQGQRTRSGRAGAAARKWADRFTEHFDELANEDSSFGQLRNVMDLAVVAALLHKEGLTEHVGLELPAMRTKYQIAEYPAPREVPSKASFINKRGKQIVTASGGVQFFPWRVAESFETSASLDAVRNNPAPESGTWYWQ